jgi:hypothetical protein
MNNFEIGDMVKWTIKSINRTIELEGIFYHYNNDGTSFVKCTSQDGKRFISDMNIKTESLSKK